MDAKDEPWQGEVERFSSSLTTIRHLHIESEGTTDMAQAAARVAIGGETYETTLQRATLAHGEGRLDEAEHLYGALLDAPDAQVGVLHYVLGILRGQKGEKAAALDAYDSARWAGYARPDLTLARADLLRQLGRPVEALEAYDRAIALGLGSASVHNKRGVVLEGLGETEAAIGAYDAAIALDPAHALARHNKGSALLKLELYDDAIRSFDDALTLQSTIAESWNLMGMAFEGLSRHAEALLCFDQAIVLRPVYAEAFNNRSIALRWTTQFEAAVESANQALALDPSLYQALNSRGSALARLNRYEDAIADYEAALSVRPAYAGALLNRGAAREALGDPAGALADFETARRLEPSLPDAAFNTALVHLREGNYATGFALYQMRWDKPTGPHLPYPRETLWTGVEDVAGKTVLLHAEQGFGDVIQFCRFAADVAGMGATVILTVQTPLLRLAASLAGPARVLSVDETPPAFDLHIPLMNLPSALELSVEAVHRGAYLSAPADLAAAWAARLEGSPGPHIGLAWSGNPKHENDHNRSMALADLARLFDLPITLISLQKEVREPDLALLEAGAPIHRFDAALDDFCETAALIAQCDAVVAVDTAIAHLAGALGKPVMLLLPRHADWRWLSGRADSPWYPTARLFRQAEFGNWSGPVEAVRAALAQL